MSGKASCGGGEEGRGWGGREGLRGREGWVGSFQNYF